MRQKRKQTKNLQAKVAFGFESEMNESGVAPGNATRVRRERMSRSSIRIQDAIPVAAEPIYRIGDVFAMGGFRWERDRNTTGVDWDPIQRTL